MNTINATRTRSIRTFRYALLMALICMTPQISLAAALDADVERALQRYLLERAAGTAIDLPGASAPAQAPGQQPDQAGQPEASGMVVGPQPKMDGFRSLRELAQGQGSRNAARYPSVEEALRRAREGRGTGKH